MQNPKSKSRDSKPCNRKNCLYYGMAMECPYRMVCEYSVLSTWMDRHFKEFDEKGDRRNADSN